MVGDGGDCVVFLARYSAEGVRLRHHLVIWAWGLDPTGIERVEKVRAVPLELDEALGDHSRWADELVSLQPLGLFGLRPADEPSAFPEGVQVGARGLRVEDCVDREHHLLFFDCGDPVGVALGVIALADEDAVDDIVRSGVVNEVKLDSLTVGHFEHTVHVLREERGELLLGAFGVAGLAQCSVVDVHEVTGLELWGCASRQLGGEAVGCQVDGILGALAGRDSDAVSFVG
eukprot:m.373537 g.373537  ORF g.373537 m.373537 type:complete len:231 (-) comp16690_c0_seq26:3302-3994(-)